MKVYCSHSNKKVHKESNYIVCKLCPAAWYASDPIPMVVIGCTEQYEVDKDYLNRWVEKDLSQKVFIRCIVCKDLLGKRKHFWCTFKKLIEVLIQRHKESIENIKIVVTGFRKDK